jgi:chemotaxis protein CheX
MSAVVKFENKNPLLNSEVIKAFVESVKTTITTMTSLQITAEKPYADSPLQIQTEIAGVVGITSNENRGLLIISFSKEAILAVHNTMLGETETELSQSVVDVVGELSNMIYGASKSELNKMGYNFQMAIPTIAKGTFEITNKSKSLTIMMPFKINDQHKFMVAVSVE